MNEKPSIAIVGAGNFGGGLTLALRGAGYSIDEVVTRGASFTRARLEAQVIWFCVPDGEIARAAKALSGTADWRGKVALHSSGALGSDELAVLRRRGAEVASVHPLMTFVRGARPALDGVSWAIEGDAPAVRVARRMLKALGGKAYAIRPQDKAAYHAWGTFASPLLIALLATTERVAALAGVNRAESKRRMLPILRQTLANYAVLDVGKAFSGPIVRGDSETLKRHLRVLRAVPEAREVYVALARAAGSFLPGKKKSSVRKSLKR